MTFSRTRAFWLLFVTQPDSEAAKRIEAKNRAARRVKLMTSTDVYAPETFYIIRKSIKI